jgi:hypothetical protein
MNRAVKRKLMKKNKCEKGISNLLRYKSELFIFLHIPLLTHMHWGMYSWCTEVLTVIQM